MNDKEYIMMEEVKYKYYKLVQRLCFLANIRRNTMNTPYCDLTKEQIDELNEFYNNVWRYDIKDDDAKTFVFEMKTGQTFSFKSYNV